MKNILTLLFLIVSIKLSAQYQLGSTVLDTTEIYGSLNEPWEILMGEDSNLWVSEKAGIVTRIHPITGQKSIILDIQNLVWQFAESGLLGMCFSLDFNNDHNLFLAYTYLDGNSRFLKVVSYSYQQSSDTLINETTLIDSIPANTFHDGCRLIFLHDSTLLITTGDAGNTNLPQNKNSLAGKILRINDNGSIPFDNPNPSSEIFSSGHRNPQGLFLHNNTIYSSEHGPANDDEINIIHSSRNYGWPAVHGFCDAASEIQFCNDSNVVEPIFAWTPTLATSDLVVYNHPSIPEWNNTILMTTLKNQSIVALNLNLNGDSVTSAQTHFMNEWGRLRDICIGWRGELYAITNGFSRNGNQGQHKIIKIENLNYTSLFKNENIKHLKLGPNPTQDELKINTELKGLANIYSINGILIESITVDQNTTLDVSSYKAGVYFIQFYNNSNVRINGKFIKN